MTNEKENQIANAIDNVEHTLRDYSMGTDDIYGFTPNSNLGQIASNLYEISETLKQILEQLKK